MGLTEDELYETTLRSFLNRVKGFSEANEMYQRQEWERTRWQAAAIANYLSKKPVKPGDLLKLPWDVDRLEKPLTAEERKQRFAEMDRRMKQRFNG